MPVIGSNHEDRIDIRPVQNLPEVLVSIDLLATDLLDLLLGVLVTRGEDIADRGDAALVINRQGLDVPGSHTTRSDDSDAHLVIDADTRGGGLRNPEETAPRYAPQ